jgi:hypothetical protein
VGVGVGVEMKSSTTRSPLNFIMHWLEEVTIIMSVSLMLLN